jgi:hypothetical protein
VTPTPAPTATATPNATPGTAILVLNTWRNGALNAGGKSSLTATNGSIMVNSANRSGAKTSGDASVTVAAPGQTRVVGLATGDGFSPPAVTGAQSEADPLAGYAVPDADGMPSRTQNGSTLEPGVYNAQIRVRDGQTVTLQPGVYVLRDGLKLEGAATILGSGVTLYIAPNDKGDCPGKLDFDKKATHTLSAPTSGAYQGLLVYQDVACTGEIKWSGTAASRATGTIYVPTGELKLDGGIVDFVGQLIVDRLTLSGEAVATVRFDPNAVAHR